MQNKNKSVNQKITYSKPQTTVLYNSSYSSVDQQEIKHSTINSNKIERIEYLKEKEMANLDQHQKQIYRLGKGLFTYQEVARLKEAFEKYSSLKNIKKPPRSRLNANGVRQIIHLEPESQISLSEKQLEKLFIDAQIPLHSQTLSHIVRQLSKKKGKGISFADIMEIVTLPSASLDEAEDYVNIFQMYDRNNRGYFDFDDYKYVCQGIAKDLSEDEMHQAFQAMNSDKSGKIDLGTFTKIMKFLN